MKIVDSSCLICIFGEINKPFILFDWIKRGYQIVITEQVYRELQKNNNTLKRVDPYIRKGDIQVKNLINEKEFILFKNRYHPMLGEGEISVILTAINLEKQGKRYYAVIDDKKARKIAEEEGIKLTGTYGLLKKLMEKEIIKEEKFNLCKNIMDKSNFRINFDKIK